MHFLKLWHYEDGTPFCKGKGQLRTVYLSWLIVLTPGHQSQISQIELSTSCLSLCTKLQEGCPTQMTERLHWPMCIIKENHSILVLSAIRTAQPRISESGHETSQTQHHPAYNISLLCFSVCKGFFDALCLKWHLYDCERYILLDFPETSIHMSNVQSIYSLLNPTSPDIFTTGTIAPHQIRTQGLVITDFVQLFLSCNCRILLILVCFLFLWEDSMGKRNLGKKKVYLECRL